jgi:hypothetical protein
MGLTVDQDALQSRSGLPVSGGEQLYMRRPPQQGFDGGLISQCRPIAFRLRLRLT